VTVSDTGNPDVGPACTIDLAAAARDALGVERFRPGQREAIAALLEGRDTVAVMAAG
jgi:superfamily II DNA helicase RecQ